MGRETERQMDILILRQMYKWIDGEIDRCTNGWMEIQTDGHFDTQTNAQMDR